MNTRGGTPTQFAVMALFALSCFGLLTFLWVSFGGAIPLRPEGYRIVVPMKEVSGLGPSADVRISGVPVGKVATVEREGDHTLVELELQSRYAPLPSDARALLRRKTLLGEAYVELTPGTRAARPLREGERLPAAQVKPSVELDEIFASFDKPTREATKAWLRGWEAGVRGRGEDISATVGHLPGAVEEAAGVLGVLRAQRRATATVVRDSGRTFGVLGRQESRVRELIDAGSRAFATTAGRERDLAATVRAFPGFLRSLDAALAATDAIAGPGTPVLRDLRPAARRLAPTLARAAQVAPDLEALTGDLDRLLDVSRPGLDALRATVRAARPLIDRLHPLGRNLAPAADYVNLYRRELVNSWPKVGAAVQAKSRDPVTNKLIHYLRAYVVLPNELLVAADRRAPYSRPNAYAAPGSIREFEKGYARAFDCSHTKNPVTIPPLGPAPPCLEQSPVAFRGKTQRYIEVKEAP